VDYKGEVDFDYNLLNPKLLNPSLFKPSKNSQLDISDEFPLDDAIVWIDPLDGTTSYTKNELDGVTTVKKKFFFKLI